jgi:hypothetical protein
MAMLIGRARRAPASHTGVAFMLACLAAHRASRIPLAP